MARIELTKVNTDGTKDVLFQQVVRDNTNEITESFIALTDEKEIENFEVNYKNFSDYMDEMSDKYSDIYS